ncbi:MAG: glycoside hydrolase family 3 C-terminal domain-containing protein [Oscillospiraceae bacterium]|nr:glycoside hydrolase family 3 C-terminal domain-containing protein [Oscillospiraceae bacterium]
MYPFEDVSLSLEARVSDLLSRLTLEEKIGFLSTHQYAVPRFGIGEWYVGHEIARGLVNREQEKPSTVFPQPIGMAASFDPEMMYKIGLTAGREARAYYNESKRGGLMVWGPTVDLSRDPRWGRNEECYGEDPFLTGEMTIAYTKGLRGEASVSATIPTLKHFCANNHEQERAVDSANLSPRLSHEHYYAAFRPSITRGGAGSIMTAYNDICHAPAVMNHDLKNVLKKEWGLGFIVTDGADFSQNVTAHKVFSSHAEALRACLHAGSDVMTDVDTCVHAAARKALDDGLISEADVDLAVGNVLRGRFALGHFDPSTPYDELTRTDVNTPADRALNLRAAKEGMVLLENQGILPLCKDKSGTIALLGPNGDCNLPDWYTGTSSYQISVKQGLEEAGCKVIADEGWDIIKIEAPNGRFLRLGEDEALYADADIENAEPFYYCHHDAKHRWVNLKSVSTGRFLHIPGKVPCLGGTLVYAWFTSETLHVDTHSLNGAKIISDYLHGKQFTLDENGKVILRKKARPNRDVMFRMHTISNGAERLEEIAKQADTVIYCAGNDPEQVAKECWDRESILLPPVQREAVERLCILRDDLVLLIVSSYPYALQFDSHRPAAILYTCHAGPELGHAVCETIFGENNPAGRLPQTWYACDEDLADIRDYDVVKNKMTYRWFDGEPLYPFGHGLSYSKFSYDAFECAAENDGIHVSVMVTNTSDTDGDEVVQFYAHACSQRIVRPDKQLCAFRRIHIKKKQTETVSCVIPYRELEIYDVSRERFCFETGDYEIMVGASSADIRFSEIVHAEGEIIPPRDFSNTVDARLYDRQDAAEIFTDALTGRTRVQAMGWTSSVTYQNVSFDGIQKLIVMAGAPVEEGCIRIYLDENKKPIAEVRVPSVDGYWDFRSCETEIDIQGCHDLTLVFGSHVSVSSIRLV